MTIKSRVKKLEQERGEKLQVLVPRVFCAQTVCALTEATKQAKFVGGEIKREFSRTTGESLLDFKKES